MKKIPLKLLYLTVASGLLQIVIFPMASPLSPWQSAVAWVAMVPLLLALLGNRTDGQQIRIRDCALLGYLCGIIWYLGSCYWIYQTMHIYGGIPTPAALGILLLFCLYLGLYHALFAALLGVIRRYTPLQRSGALFAAPFLWVAVELARARITGFPWDQLGVTQVDNSLLTLSAPFAGVYAISFIVFLANAQIASAWIFNRTTPRLQAVATGVTIALVSIIGGAMHLGQPPVQHGESTAVLLQPNLSSGHEAQEPSAADLISLFSQMSLHPTADDHTGAPHTGSTFGHPQLILWPESPAPFLTSDTNFLEALTRLADTSGATVLSGANGVGLAPRTNAPVYYNSVAIFTPGHGYSARYDKIHLVPFGEYVPFKSIFSFAGGLVQEVGNSEPGTERTIAQAGGHGVGQFLCYESIFGDEIRHFALNGAQVFVNLSNDGWYGDTSAPFQHISMARMRAIENRRWLLRDTNTGITSSIDPYGRIVERIPRHQLLSATMHFNYANPNDLTFYTRFGDIFAYLCSAIAIGLLLWAVTNRFTAIEPHTPVK